MVSQFESSHAVKLLGDLDFNFPIGTHAIGRLDAKSEGLLLLTTNKKITRLLFQGVKAHPRVYLVQLKGLITDSSIKQLCEGVEFIIKNGEMYTSLPCKVSRATELLKENIDLKNFHKFSWIEIILNEGKYHQVRKMVKAVGHRCLRLIRIRIENISLGEMQPGEVVEISEETFFTSLKL